MNMLQPLRMNQKRFSNPDVAVLEETDSSTDLNDNGMYIYKYKCVYIYLHIKR
jgi:hypothetical protein